MDEILLVIVILLLGAVIFLVLRSRRVEPSDLKNVISSTWAELGLGEKIGSIDTHAQEIKKSYREFEQMLRVPKERASFGELALETILSDQLPPDMYGIRETVFDGKRPDAHIKSTEGVVCIDSKFSLDNYGRMLQNLILAVLTVKLTTINVKLQKNIGWMELKNQ